MDYIMGIGGRLDDVMGEFGSPQSSRKGLRSVQRTVAAHLALLRGLLLPTSLRGWNRRQISPRHIRDGDRQRVCRLRREIRQTWSSFDFSLEMVHTETTGKRLPKARRLLKVCWHATTHLYHSTSENEIIYRKFLNQKIPALFRTKYTSNT